MRFIIVNIIVLGYYTLHADFNFYVNFCLLTLTDTKFTECKSNVYLYYL